MHEAKKGFRRLKKLSGNFRPYEPRLLLTTKRKQTVTLLSKREGRLTSFTAALASQSSTERGTFPHLTSNLRNRIYGDVSPRLSSLRRSSIASIPYDEKPGIQAIATTAPDLPPEPERHRQRSAAILLGREQNRLTTANTMPLTFLRQAW
jgi:hypothetical protein